MGVLRHGAIEEGLLKAIDLIRGLRDEFWRNVRVLGAADTLNQSLEKAGRVADFLELGELCASTRCTGVSRAVATSVPRARPTTERPCDTTRSSPTSRRGSGAAGRPPTLHKEDLVYEFVELKQRSYK